MMITRYRDSYLIQNCPRCNFPNEPLIIAFGNVIVNKCYLCSPHLDNGYGTCMYYFGEVGELVSDHNRADSLLRVLTYMKSVGHKISHDSAALILDIFPKLEDEKVVIPRSKLKIEYKTVGGRPEPEKLPTYKKSKEKKYMKLKDRRKNFTHYRRKQTYQGFRSADWEKVEFYRKRKRTRSSRQEVESNANTLKQLIAERG